MAIRAISFYCRGLTTLRMGGCSQVSQVSAIATSCVIDGLILLALLRWQTRQFSIWPSAPCTCECSICPAVFFSRMIRPHSWWDFALRSTPSPWPAAATSPSKTGQHPVACRESSVPSLNNQRACPHTGSLPWISSHTWSTGSTATTTQYSSLEASDVTTGSSNHRTRSLQWQVITGTMMLKTVAVQPALLQHSGRCKAQWLSPLQVSSNP